MNKTLPEISEAVQLLKEGKLVVFPTETVYGVGIALSKKDKIQAIYDLKSREQNKPLTWHIADLKAIDFNEVYYPYIVSFLAHRFWPGALTLIVKIRTGDTIGFRFPQHKIARKLIEALGEPLLATSANISSEDPAVKVEQAKEAFGDKVPLYIDGGETDFKLSSTIVDLRSYPPKIIREGNETEAVKKSIEQFGKFNFMKKQILFVCTGNTCRSPMGEGWMRNYLQENGHSDQFIVKSCGTAAFGGIPPSQEGIDVLHEEDDIDISHQRSSALTPELITESDFIFVMTLEHKNYILNFYPEAESKIAVLNILDPVGMGKESYKNIYHQIKENCQKELAWVLKS